MSGVLKKINESGSESVLFAHKAFRLLEKKQKNEALELSREGVKRFPFFAEGHYLLARCHQALGQNEQARDEYRQTLTYMPGHIRALKALSYLHYKAQQTEAAYGLLRIFALYDPLNSELHDFLKSEDLLKTAPAENTEISETQPDREELLESDFDTEIEEELFDDRPTDLDETTLLDLEGEALAAEDYSEITAIEPEQKTSGESFESDEDPGAKEAVREEFERNNIVNHIDEQEQFPSINLDNFDNQEDDFSTIADDLFEKQNPEETTENALQETFPEAPAEAEPEILAEERPVLDSTLVFNENRQQAQEAGDGGEAFENFNSIADEIERLSAQIPDEIEEHMAQTPYEEVPAVEENQEANALSPLSNGEILPNQKPLPEEIIPQVKNAPGQADVAALEEEAAIEEAAPENDEADHIPPIAEKERPTTAPEQTAQKAGPPKDESAPPKAMNDENVDIEDILSNPSLLTPTFGEILIAQRKFEDARRVFSELAKREPENVRFKKKIEFLDKIVAMNRSN